MGLKKQNDREKQSEIFSLHLFTDLKIQFLFTNIKKASLFQLYFLFCISFFFSFWLQWVFSFWVSVEKKHFRLIFLKTSVEVYIYIYISHHVVPLARISLTFSRHFSLSFIASGRSSGLHPVSSHSCCMYVLAGRPAFARPYVRGSIGVHHLWARLCFSSSVLHVWFV